MDEWLELSASSLAAGRFLERPTLESIRALLLLALHYVVLGLGDSGGAGIAYLTLAMQSCIQVSAKVSRPVGAVLDIRQI